MIARRLVLRVPAPDDHHGHEPDDVRDGNMPPLLQPGADVACFRIPAADRDTRRASEPDHRTTVPDREGQDAPVVPTLVEGELGEGNVVEDAGHEAETHGHGPGRRGERLHGHERRRHHESQQEHRTESRRPNFGPVRVANGDGHDERAPDRRTDHWELVRQLGSLHVHQHIGDHCDHQHECHNAEAVIVDVQVDRRVLHNRLVLVLLLGRDDAGHDQRGDGRHIGVDHVEGRLPGQPHHGGGGVTDHRAGTARIGRRDDGRQIPDVQPLLEDYARGGDPNQGRRDVVEEGAEHEDQREEPEAAGPVVGQPLGEELRDAAVLEVLAQQGEPRQQAQQVGHDHPFVVQVLHEVEVRVAELESEDRHQTAEGDPQLLVVEPRHTQQGEREQDELDRDAEEFQGVPP